MAAGHVYYDTCEGRWRGPMQVTVTDLEQARAALAPADFRSLRLLARWPRWLGGLEMHTSVRRLNLGCYRHTTAICWGPLPLVKSVEVVTLGPDGQSLQMIGRSRALPTPWKVERFEGPGRVADDVGSARYELTWLGVPIVQTAERTRDRVTLHQRGPGFEARQPLDRQTPFEEPGAHG